MVCCDGAAEIRLDIFLPFRYDKKMETLTRARKDRAEQPLARAAAWMIALSLGACWALFDVVLGGLLQSARVPHRGAFLCGCALAFLGSVPLLVRRAYGWPAVVLMAVAVQASAVWTLGLNISCRANSLVALGCEGAAVAFLWSASGQWAAGSQKRRAVIGFAAGLAAAFSFHIAGRFASPCADFLAIFRLGSLGEYLLRKALPWAVAGALFFPAGYALAARLGPIVIFWHLRRPLPFYGFQALAIALSWLANVGAIAAV